MRSGSLLQQLLKGGVVAKVIEDRRSPNDIPLKDFAAKEGRYSLLARSKPQLAERLMDLAQEDVNERRRLYEQMAGIERK